MAAIVGQPLCPRVFESGWDPIPDCCDSLLLPALEVPRSHISPWGTPPMWLKLQAALPFHSESQVRTAPGSDSKRSTEHRHL